jgi:ubiquinone biosynthesis protein
MISKLAPGYNHMESFREEVSRLTTRHFSPPRIKETTTKLAREMERLIHEAPGDTRRILRRFAEGGLGRLPSMEAVGRRFNRNLERLTGAIAFAALVISGSMLLLSPIDDNLHAFGEFMVVCGFAGILISRIRALRRDPDQR